ncbi:MAG: hypothetical protein QW223_00885, partial [Candidatus Caldarchaeum sp.]
VLKPLLSRWYKVKRALYMFSDRDFQRLVEALSTYRIKSLNPRREITRAVMYVALKHPAIFWKVFKAWTGI